jgi:hypothetical protein
MERLSIMVPLLAWSAQVLRDRVPGREVSRHCQRSDTNTAAEGPPSAAMSHPRSTQHDLERFSSIR